MMASDVKAGKPAEQFGDHGVVTLKTPESMRGYDKNYALTSPPGIYKNLVMTGGWGPEESRSISGDERAWDVRPGKLVWTFHGVPHDGEFGAETWAPGSRKDRA